MLFSAINNEPQKLERFIWEENAFLSSHVQVVFHFLLQLLIMGNVSGGKSFPASIQNLLIFTIFKLLTMI